MQNPFDPPPDDEAFEPTEAERQAAAAPPVTRGAQRSSADDVLDLIGGVTKPKVRDLRFCPVCGAATKVRGNSVQGGTMTRRCTNSRCKNEFPIVTHRAGVDSPPLYPDPMLNGGPYPVGPSRGGTSMPAIDPNQPISRRLSEFGRRVNQED